MFKKVRVTLEELKNDEGGCGLEIYIPGTKANLYEKEACPIFVEYYDGKLRVLIWDETTEPQVITLKIKPEYEAVMNAAPDKLPLLMDVKDEDARELLKSRLKNMEYLQKRMPKK